MQKPNYMNFIYVFSEPVKVKCDDPGTLVKYGVTTVPQLVFFRGGNPVLYESMYLLVVWYFVSYKKTRIRHCY